MKKKKVTLTVARWENDLKCPKCLVQADEGESDYEVFHCVHLEYTDLLFLTCKTCGFNWLMESADAT